MANPGYGKRTVPDQHPHTAADFAHLPPREASIAAYIDRLKDGADISVKTLAKVLPHGQCALRTALNAIQAAGHLRRGREHLAGSGSQQWVTRTWWSRTPRDDAWWAAFRRGDVPDDRQRPTRSRAMILLVALGREAPVMSLSAVECAQLAPLVEEWFARGATEKQVLGALTTGLPAPVIHPAGLARRRLTDKLPPEPIPTGPPPLRLLECGKCGAPARAESLRGGDCGPCRGEPNPAPRTNTLSAAQVHAHMTEVRAAATRPYEGNRT
ncbi:hypothetical protein ACWCXB_03850 [Streptomyces sp. NPDC001514]